MRQILAGLFLFYIFCVILQSCTSYKHISYFEDVPDTAKPFFAQTAPFKNPVIQTGDLLTITIQTIDNSITSVINSNSSNVNGGSTSETAQGSGTSTALQQAPNSYLVDNDGNVDLPFISVTHVSGLTTAQAKNLVFTQIDKYFNNAIVNVRFSNFKITVLGEVNHPSTYIVPNEKVNIFDAMGLAGDMTVFGIRTNVLLLRDSSDGKKIIRLNLDSKNIVSSPWFYLQPNDVVYVEPSKSKVASVDAIRNRNITLLASSFTVLLALIAFFK